MYAREANQRFAVELEPDHGELSGFEAERWMASDSEAKQTVGPVPNVDNFFG
jgi:hypothetical protein